MKFSNIEWREDGWTLIQEADPAKHILEITCLAAGGQIVEVRKRHSHGEEIVLKGKLDDAHTLPMALADFKAAIKKNEINFK